MSIVHVNKERAMDALYSYLAFAEAASMAIYDSVDGDHEETNTSIMAHELWSATLEIRKRYDELGPANKKLHPEPSP